MELSNEEINRLRGVFYGQAVGDALGSRYEFCSEEVAKKKIIEDKANNPDGVLPMLGTQLLKPGQITDDTEMALCLARSLIAKNTFDPVDVACSYLQWMQFRPANAGIATRNALVCEGVKRLPVNWRRELEETDKRKLYQQICSQVQQKNQDSLSNGMLMRVSPLAIAFRNLPFEQLKLLAEEDCKLTHCHPIVLEAVSVYVVALVSLIKGKDRQEVYQDALQQARHTLVHKILQQAQFQPSCVLLPDNSTIKGDQKSMGYFGVALQGAFYQLLHAKDFSEALEEVVGRGEDTDTNGCIASSLLGAYFGADSIPQEWIEAVKKAPPGTGSSSLYCLKDAENMINGLSMIF